MVVLPLPLLVPLPLPPPVSRVCSPREYREAWGECVKLFLDCAEARAQPKHEVLSKNGFAQAQPSRTRKGGSRERSRLYWNLPVVRVSLLRDDDYFQNPEKEGLALQHVGVMSSLGPCVCIAPDTLDVRVCEKFLVVLSDAVPAIMIADRYEEVSKDSPMNPKQQQVAQEAALEAAREGATAHGTMYVPINRPQHYQF